MLERRIKHFSICISNPFSDGKLRLLSHQKIHALALIADVRHLISKLESIVTNLFLGVKV